MKKETHPLANQIHRYFGVYFNNSLWNYFDKKKRTDEENDDMIGMAFSALTHWKIFKGGTIVNVQRGEYMVAKAFYKAGNKTEALRHAEICLKLTLKHSSEMKDFDFAFAYEIMAAVKKMYGNIKDFKKYKDLAEKYGNEIADKDDKRVYFVEFYRTFGKK